LAVQEFPGQEEIRRVEKEGQAGVMVLLELPGVKVPVLFVSSDQNNSLFQPSISK
jgi:hypothetical protein